MKPNPLSFILFSLPLTFSNFSGQAQDTLLPIYVFSEQVALLENPQLNAKRIAIFAFGDTLYFESGENGSVCYHPPISKYVEDSWWYNVKSKSGEVGWVKAEDVSVHMKVNRGKHHQVVFQSFCGDGIPSWRMGQVYDTKNKLMTTFADSVGFNKGFWMNQDQDFIFSDDYSLWGYNVNSKTVKRVSSLHGDFFVYGKTKLAYVRATNDCSVNATIRFGIIDTTDFVMHDLLTIDSPKLDLGEDGGEGEPNYSFSLIRKDGVDHVTFKINTLFSGSL